LLPLNGTTWEAVDQNRARVIFTVDDERYALELTMAADGRPRSVLMQRWTNANADHVFRYQPFGATVLEMGSFSGYRIPIRIDGGNWFGTDAYFPFFRAQVTQARFL
jgi:hypothetical protein